jgi:hypothetical protein
VLRIASTASVIEAWLILPADFSTETTKSGCTADVGTALLSEACSAPHSSGRAQS